MKLKSLHIAIALIVCCLNTTVRAQVKPARLSFEVNAGVPLMYGSIPSKFSTFGGAGLRYNLTQALSAQVSFNIGTMRGEHSQNTNKYTFPENVSNYKSYTSQFYSYSLRGQLNLEKVFNLRRFSLFNRINPYLIAGVGYTAPWGDGYSATRFFGASEKIYKNGVKPFWTTQVGLAFRYYINPMLDLNLGTEFNHVQSYYLDGIYVDKKYDFYQTTYIGVNIKFGASKAKQHIEWQNVVLIEHRAKSKPVEVPKPQEQKPVAIIADPVKEAVKSDSLLAKESSNEVKQPTSTEVVTTPQSSTQDPITDASKAKENTPIAKTTSKTGVKTNQGKETPEATNNTKQDNVVRVNAATDKNAPSLNMMEGVAPQTLAKYTVIAGAYGKSKVKYAYMFRDRLRKQGYQAALVQSDIDPNIVRVMVYTTNNKKVALQQCYKVRSEYERAAWINVKK